MIKADHPECIQMQLFNISEDPQKKLHKDLGYTIQTGGWKNHDMFSLGKGLWDFDIIAENNNKWRFVKIELTNETVTFNSNNTSIKTFEHAKYKDGYLRFFAGMSGNSIKDLKIYKPRKR